ncbi:MAG: hypothetical protein ACLF0G_12995 [Candidatus Brocadiia bacterium]
MGPSLPFLLAAAALGAGPGPPPTAPPIVYVINYSGRYFAEPDYIERFRQAPPDLLHVGKAVPISHHWGPIRLYQGENQYTGGPGHTLSWENIALLSPQALERRVATIRRTLRRYHAVGIPEIVPYISYHTLAGDHRKRLGFWNFYDHWEPYERWAGPKPEHDPAEWLAVDREGRLLPGSCGGYSPDYYAPLHRYRACIHHPEWAEWHRRLVRMIAEVGYDGCFVDNAHPDPCFCPHCKRRFRRWLGAHRDLAWVRRLTEGLDFDELALDAPGVPPELVRRWRVLATRDHLGRLRETGRTVKPGFAIFPNSGRIDECLQVGGKADRLMFESTFAPGIACAGEPPASDAVTIAVVPGPVEPDRTVVRYSLADRVTHIELEADVELPARAQAGRPVRLEVRLRSVGASLRDGDAAEDFRLLLRDEQGREAALPLQPPGPVGGTSSSRKPRQPPATLGATWRPSEPGTYGVWLAFRYTDDSHRATTTLRPHVARLSRGRVCRTHLAELLFTQHMYAAPIYLSYEARKHDSVQELALAEMAAFGGGGGVAGRGEPQARYRAFFKAYPRLFEGWTLTAPAAVVYAYWGPNPLDPQRPGSQPTIADALGESHRPFVALVDRSLPERAGELAAFRALYFPSPAYELGEAQLAALRQHAKERRGIILGHPGLTLNGRPAAELLGIESRALAEGDNGAVWDWRLARGMDLPAEGDAATERAAARRELAPTAPIAPSDGRRRSLRFALYRKGRRLALHAVNYNVCLLPEGRPVLVAPPTPVQVPLPQGWTAARATRYRPGAEPMPLPCTVDEEGGMGCFTLPPTRIYQVVVLERRAASP